MTLEPGLEATVEHVVRSDDLAVAHGSGDLEVLATPALGALFERAAVDAVTPALPDDQTTVGSWIELDHRAPTLPGGRVVVRARLEEVDGRRLTFSCEASDEGGEIGSARHHRALVDRGRFMDGARGRT